MTRREPRPALAEAASLYPSPNRYRRKVEVTDLRAEALGRLVGELAWNPVPRRFILLRSPAIITLLTCRDGDEPDLRREGADVRVGDHFVIHFETAEAALSFFMEFFRPPTSKPRVDDAPTAVAKRPTAEPTTDIVVVEANKRPKRPPQPRPEKRGSVDAPRSSGSEDKRMRRLDESCSSASSATASEPVEHWVVAQFGSQWPERIHKSHCLSLHPPLVYCRRCGAYAQANLHLSGLIAACEGEPRPSTLYYVRKRLLAGEHSTKRQRLEGLPTPIAPST